MQKKVIGTVFSVTLMLNSIGTVWAQTPTCAPNSVCTDVSSPSSFRVTSLGKLISSTFAFLLVVAGLLAFVYLIIGGIQWITSGGDKAGLEAARNRIVHAIVGLIVVFAAWAITLLLQQFLGITILGNLTIPRAYDVP